MRAAGRCHLRHRAWRRGQGLAVGDSVTVSATFSYWTVTGLFSALLNAPLEISRSATSEIF
jgi:hypothetical protein